MREDLREWILTVLDRFVKWVAAVSAATRTTRTGSTVSTVRLSLTAETDRTQERVVERAIRATLVASAE
jgi:hypothetical protein